MDAPGAHRAATAHIRGAGPAHPARMRTVPGAAAWSRGVSGEVRAVDIMGGLCARKGRFVARVVGIDLGTTRSRICYLAGGSPAVLAGSTLAR